jgi:hypothetical protein
MRLDTGGLVGAFVDLDTAEPSCTLGHGPCNVCACSTMGLLATEFRAPRVARTFNEPIHCGLDLSAVWLHYVLWIGIDFLR